METKESRIRDWLESPLVSEEEKAEIRAMSPEELDDAFYKQIEFGTAGMRGVLGPGTNRMNEFTVKRANVAFAKALLSEYGEDAYRRGVAISHDNRFRSRELAELSASILNEMGIDAYLFDALRPTPELSFAVRYLHCVGGIMITASHNPKEHNGYKVYDEKGCQLVPHKIAPVLEEIAKMPCSLKVDVEKAAKPGVTHIIGKQIDDAYIDLVKKIQVNPDLPKKGFRIVYTPQHGASYENAMRVFKELGYEVYPVKKQCNHDPAFGGTKSPNPENPVAYEESIKLAKRKKAHLIVMTDPDGDRVGLAYLGIDKKYHLLTGNESASCLLDYILSSLARKGELPNDGVMYDTVVSSDLCRKIAQSYGVFVESFLTGFKFIGEAIAKKEEAGIPSSFLFGYEESYGCLIAPFVRDKDGIQAILLYCEMALYHFLGHKSLDVVLDGIMQVYGYHLARGHSYLLEGSSGFEKIKAIMNSLHDNPPSEIAGIEVAAVEDYKNHTVKDAEGSRTFAENLPASELVKLILKDGSWIAVRPSGTEPKIKFYIETVNKKARGLEKKNEAFVKGLEEKFGL